MKTHTQGTVTKEGKETRGRVANEVRDDWWSVKHEVSDATGCLTHGFRGTQNQRHQGECDIQI